MAWYATPRMTRDLDIVVALKETDVDALVDAFLPDFYVDRDAASLAVRTERLFNLMHLASGIKVDLIIRKSSLGYWAERIGVARELEETLRCMTPPPTLPDSSGSSTPG